LHASKVISLAADEIVICAHAVLGPVDPQLGQYPAASIIKVARQRPIAEIDDQTLILADQARSSIFRFVTGRVTRVRNRAIEKGRSVPGLP
jgi:ClpP class serine protease